MMDIILKDENTLSGQTLPTITHILGSHSKIQRIQKSLETEVSLMALIVQPTRRLSLKMEALQAANSYNPQRTHP